MTGIAVPTMAGKTCLVTGATAGIGLAAAMELARLGAHVVLTGRDPDRCAAAVESIRRITGNSAVECLIADLSSQREVRRLAYEFRARHNRLHVLINNAGALFALRRESVDGIEMTLALNHLGPFLLTHLLLDTLRISAPARVVNVSSGAHKDVNGFDFEDPQALHRSPNYGTSEFASLLITLTRPWGHPGVVQYAQSELGNLLLNHELAARLAGTGITANALHPGFVRTKFTSGNGALGAFMRFWARILGISPERGAETMVYLASSPEVEEVTGQYFVKKRPVPSSPAAQDASAARRLWRLSEEWTSTGHDNPSTQ